MIALMLCLTLVTPGATSHKFSFVKHIFIIYDIDCEVGQMSTHLPEALSFPVGERMAHINLK
jgi:hypothetical protein